MPQRSEPVAGGISPPDDTPSTVQRPEDNVEDASAQGEQTVAPEPPAVGEPTLLLSPVQEPEYDRSGSGVGYEGRASASESTPLDDATLDRLAAQILEVRQQHDALKQDRLVQMSLGELKKKLRILRVDRQKIEAVDHEAEPHIAAARLLIRAEKPQSESWRVAAALHKEHDAAQKLASAKTRRLRDAAAGKLDRAQQFVEIEKSLSEELARCSVERLRVTLADGQQILKGEQLSQQREELKCEKEQLCSAEEYGQAQRIQEQIDEVTAQLRSISHSLRPHHLVAASRPSTSRVWHRTLPPSTKGLHVVGQIEGPVPAKSRATNPFGSNTHKVDSGWHGRTWHMSGGREPSPDKGAREHAASIKDRNQREGSRGSRSMAKKMEHHGSSVWHGPGGSPGRFDEQPVENHEPLSPSSWSTSAREIGGSSH